MLSLLFLGCIPFAFFALERFHFKVRHGGFAVIFYVFCLQTFLILATNLMHRVDVIDPESTIGMLIVVAGGLSLYTIFVTVSLALVCAIFWFLMKIGERIFSDKK